MYFLFVFFITLIGCNIQDENIEPAEIDVNRTVQYKSINDVDNNLLYLDIYYSSYIDELKPIVIYIHGGGWCIGDKTNKLENKIQLFRSLNYILISVNYRLSPFPYETSNPDRIKYPTHNIDIADAIKWVFDNIEQYGGNKNKIVLLGHSAGAHLVALTGTNKKFIEQVGLSLSNIRGIAAFDTQGYDVLNQVKSGHNWEMYTNAFGTDIGQNTDASPIFNVYNSIIYPKFFIAKRGSSQRIALADDFIDKLEINGVTVFQINGSKYDHEGINNAIGEENETLITDPLKKFLSECFN